MTETAVREGGCLCGAIRYRMTGQSLGSIICTCRDCQKQGGALPVFVRCPLDQFELIAGTPATYRASSSASRQFCSQCGSFLFWRHDHGRHVGIALGSFDDPSSMGRPTVQIFASRSAPWLPAVAGIQTFDEWPEPGAHVNLPWAGRAS
jgi:hypothetical protein